MKVMSTGWQASINKSMYRTALRQRGREVEKAIPSDIDEMDCTSILEETDPEEDFDLVEALEDSQSGYKPKSSVPKSEVGAYAAMVAKAKSKFDLIQVNSKATRALINLKIAAAFAEGDDKKKISQQVARMEKVMKRINKKMRQLSKEEQLELEQERAMKKQDMEKVEELQKELKKRRMKRRKEEKKFADEEQANDKIANDEILAASMPGSGAEASVSEMTTAIEAGIVPDAVTPGISTGDMAIDTGFSLDITI